MDGLRNLLLGYEQWGKNTNMSPSLIYHKWKTKVGEGAMKQV